jgi:hypothetical protein
VFENRVLRRILGPKRDDVTGGWRKLHNEELHNLYCSPSTRMGEKKNAYRILMGKPEGRPRHRWEDNIKMDLREIG